MPKLMVEHAAERGASAIIGMRYDANEVMAGVTEVLAYGTGCGRRARLTSSAAPDWGSSWDGSSAA